MQTGEDLAAEVAGWDSAPSVIESVQSVVELTPQQCDIEFWVQSVAQGTLRGLVRGRRPDAVVPDFLLRDGPLRTTLIEECAFRSISEEYATKACALATAAADDVLGLEFFATQTLDEVRHAYTFRMHLLDLGVPPDELHETIARVAGANAQRLLHPMWEWGIKAYESDFVSGVVIITILLEGVLAPTTELAEKKWKALSPATADIERGACVDEVRHLAVGSWFIKDHLERHPEDKPRILDLIVEGRQVWNALPTPELILQREALFQEGIEEHREAIGDVELMPGMRLVDTTAADRLGLALAWAQEVQDSRLHYMGLGQAIPPAGG